MDKFEIIKKVQNFLDAYERVMEEKESDESERISFYESLDENYDLVVLRVPIVGDVVSIADKDWIPIFYYIEEDEWTIGDLIGGYLDLYTK